ncbi:MAG: hypothetical protein U0136_18685 [Bdellovibrionota bacterium]
MVSPDIAREVVCVDVNDFEFRAELLRWMEVWSNALYDCKATSCPNELIFQILGPARVMATIPRKATPNTASTV